MGGVVGCAVGGVATSNFTFVASRLQNGARFVCQAGGVVSPLVLLNVQGMCCVLCVGVCERVCWYVCWCVC